MRLLCVARLQQVQFAVIVELGVFVATLTAFRLHFVLRTLKVVAVLRVVLIDFGVCCSLTVLVGRKKRKWLEME